MSSSPIQPIGDFKSEYDALTGGVGVADYPNRTLIEVAGSDRIGFMQNFCTNDVERVATGSGCELFVLNVKGKILGYGIALCGTQSVVLETARGQAEKLIEHLDRYVIREDVQLTDRSTQWAELLLIGPESPSIVESQLGVAAPSARLCHTTGHWQGADVNVCQIDFFGPISFLLRAARETIQSLEAGLADVVVACGAQAIETLRIESGTPEYGRDISEDNLPQEVNRDDRAISLTKGCYLGQETVARIDALGHVNKTLGAVRLDGQTVPAPGTELSVDGKEAGQVTSAIYSPKLDAPLALAYLRRGNETAGRRLESPSGAAEVVALPWKR